MAPAEVMIGPERSPKFGSEIFLTNAFHLGINDSAIAERRASNQRQEGARNFESFD
jgi:hypothetical protein